MTHTPTPEPVPVCGHGYDGPHAVYHDALVSGCHGFESRWLYDCEGPDASVPPAPSECGE